MASGRRAGLGLERTVRGQHNSQRGEYVALPRVGTVQETRVEAAASDPVNDLKFAQKPRPGRSLPAMWQLLSVHTVRSKCCDGDSFEPHEFHRFSSAERWKGNLDRRSLPHQRSYVALEGSCSVVSKRTSPRGKIPNIWPLSRHIDTTPYSACS